MIARLSFILAITFALSLLPETGVGLALQARRHSNRSMHSNRSAHKRQLCMDAECLLEKFGFSKAVDVHSGVSHKLGNPHQGQDQYQQPDQYQPQQDQYGGTDQYQPQQDQYGGPDKNSDKEIYLRMHNDLRAKHKADPLEWDDRLAAAAQQWADQCVFEHSTGQLGDLGENLSVGGGNFGARDAVQLWINEAPDHDAYGGQEVLDHYTQMVWKGSKKIGCASRSGCTGIFGDQLAVLHVCEYHPPGNVVGYIRDNVSF
uniref:Pathogenesis-related protein 1 n=1 Tax=Moniliophthora perniciosa TaxID=153609 RepID=A0A8E7D535_MONPR|nr:pathogenesis-related protein 1 [Moniliophthora perniciosa]QVT77534.1 pathogenesis-related protein 1 [Moniliophthora perniciosa]